MRKKYTARNSSDKEDSIYSLKVCIPTLRFICTVVPDYTIHNRHAYLRRNQIIADVSSHMFSSFAVASNQNHKKKTQQPRLKRLHSLYYTL